MALRSKMNDELGLDALEDGAHRLRVSDIRADQLIASGAFSALHTAGVRGVGELIDVIELRLSITLEGLKDKIRADEAGAAGDEDAFLIEFHMASAFGLKRRMRARA